MARTEAEIAREMIASAKEIVATIRGKLADQANQKTFRDNGLDYLCPMQEYYDDFIGNVNKNTEAYLNTLESELDKNPKNILDAMKQLQKVYDHFLEIRTSLKEIYENCDKLQKHPATPGLPRVINEQMTKIMAECRLLKSEIAVLPDNSPKKPIDLFLQRCDNFFNECAKAISAAIDSISAVFIKGSAEVVIQKKPVEPGVALFASLLCTGALIGIKEGWKHKSDSNKDSLNRSADLINLGVFRKVDRTTKEADAENKESKGREMEPPV